MIRLFVVKLVVLHVTCITRVTNMYTRAVIHLSCSAQRSSTSIPELALVIRSLSTHQLLFCSFPPPTNSGSLHLYLKSSIDISVAVDF